MSDAWDGRPQNPERDGWHWLDAGGPVLCEWRASRGWMDETWWPHAADLVYLGPCLTPQEVAAREAAAAEAMREACASMLDTDADAAERRWAENGDTFGIGSRYVATLRRYAETVRAVPLPHADALARGTSHE